MMIWEAMKDDIFTFQQRSTTQRHWVYKLVAGVQSGHYFVPETVFLKAHKFQQWLESNSAEQRQSVLISGGSNVMCDLQRANLRYVIMWWTSLL